MRFFFALLFVAFALVACSANTVECECPNMAPSVTVGVTDAVTGDAVENPTFAVNGAPANASCVVNVMSDAGPDGGTICNQWQIELPVGHSTLTVAATSYQSQVFPLDTTMSTGCCASGTQLTQSVALSH